ncbi:MAG TPA: T9SS type A sorting domain-containing protein [Chitinophagales bacterium]|nr:T9SS type A sorting domain-containing protein [Chitinophagales bacterium]
MKNLYLSVFALLLTLAAQAQCTVDPSAQTTPGVNPTAPNCPCIIRGVPYDQTLQGQIQASKDTVIFFPAHIDVDSVRIDSIQGLPVGITWTKTPNVLPGGGNGAVCFSGTTNAPAGQYPLTAYGTVWMHVTISPIMNDSAQTYTGNLNQFSPFGDYYLEVTNPGVPCHGSTVGFGVNFAAVQPVCSGATVTLAPQVANGQTPYTYAWSSTGNALSCNNCAAPTATITQNSTYTVTVTDNTNATATASVTYTVTTAVTPGVTIAGGTGACSGDALSFTATGTNGGPNATYQWLVNGAAAGTGTNLTSTTLAHGDIVKAVLTSSLGCVTAATDTSNAITVAYTNAIIGQPATVTTPAGTNAQFTVVASNVNSTYQWELNTGTGFAGLSNAGPYSGVFTSTLTVSNVNSNFNNYTFRCVVTASGCQDTTNTAALLVGPNGIGETVISKIAVYPNPAKNDISFSIEEEVTAIEIYQLQGAFVKKVTPAAQNGAIRIDISDLSSGMYFVQVKAGKTYRGAFVKE